MANEDAATASVLNLKDGKVEAVVQVKKEPEGVGFTPDGKFVYVTCETNGEVFADAKEVVRIKAVQWPWGVAIVPAPE